jgi:hypothetical protein
MDEPRNTNKKNLLRGSACYTSTSTGKLAFLNNTMTVFKSETDEDGNDQDCIRLVNSLHRRSVCSSNISSSKSCRLPMFREYYAIKNRDLLL